MKLKLDILYDHFIFEELMILADNIKIWKNISNLYCNCIVSARREYRYESILTSL